MNVESRGGRLQINKYLQREPSSHPSAELGVETILGPSYSDSVLLETRELVGRVRSWGKQIQSLCSHGAAQNLFLPSSRTLLHNALLCPVLSTGSLFNHQDSVYGLSKFTGGQWGPERDPVPPPVAWLLPAVTPCMDPPSAGPGSGPVHGSHYSCRLSFSVRIIIQPRALALA